MKDRGKALTIAAAVMALCVALLWGWLGSSGKVTGEWTCRLRALELLKVREDGTQGSLAEFFDLSGVEIKVDFFFREDGTYTVELNDESTQATLSGLVDEYLRKQGKRYDMSPDDFLALSGMSREELTATTLRRLEEEAGLAGVACRGQYRAEGGRLYVSRDPDSQPGQENYATYAGHGLDQLRITGVTGPGALLWGTSLAGEKVLPLRLTKR